MLASLLHISVLGKSYWLYPRLVTNWPRLICFAGHQTLDDLTRAASTLILDYDSYAVSLNGVHSSGSPRFTLGKSSDFDSPSFMATFLPLIAHCLTIFQSRYKNRSSNLESLYVSLEIQISTQNLHTKSRHWRFPSKILQEQDVFTWGVTFVCGIARLSLYAIISIHLLKIFQMML